ncbi:hypothetical protein TNCV_1598641, partial [Trichonephila clavipes]
MNFVGLDLTMSDRWHEQQQQHNLNNGLKLQDCCDIHFSYVRGHRGNLGNDRADQLAKGANCQDMDLSMSVKSSHWKHIAWERTVSAWNTEFLASPKYLWTKTVLLKLSVLATQ